jgi:acyl carrier protein
MLDTAKIKTRISEILGVPADKITDGAVLQELVMDSFILIDMVIDLQNTFKIRLDQEDLVPVKTVGDLISVMQTKV